MSRLLHLCSASVVAVAAFLAWTPSPSWEQEHFSDEPFVWPASLSYVDVLAAEGVILKTVVAGPSPAESKGVMIFAHGFPETAASWKIYLLHYAEQGFHVRAPDLRNVNNSQGLSGEMTLDIVIDDLMAVLKSTGQAAAILIGHDWGAAVAWGFACKYPASTTSLISLAVPHLDLYRTSNLFRFPLSLAHVWYFFFFGLTGPVARWKVAKDDFGWFVWFAFGTSRPKTYSKAEVARLRDMYRRSMLSPSTSTVTSWYSMGTSWLLKSLASSAPPFNVPSTVPTLQIFGSDDHYIYPGMFGWAANAEYVSHPNKRVVIYDASHWLLHESYSDILRDIDMFISAL